VKNVGICVVGVGRAGLVHARNYRQNVPGGSLAAIVDSDLDLAKRAGRELEKDHCLSSLQDALEAVSFDAVCIASPTFTHRELVTEAAKEGKHVFCEKPMAITMEEADEMIEAARGARVLLQMGFMRRFDPVFRAAKERIESGEIGDPMIVRSLTRGPGLPPRWACDIRTSNGMLAEVNSHDFDTIRWLAASEFEKIYAEANALKCFDLQEEFPDFYDNAVVSLRMENGSLGVIDGSCPVGYGYDARAEVLGNQGVMLIGELQDTAVVSCTKNTGLVASNFPGWRERFSEAYIAEAHHFVECIVKEEEPAVTGEDGRRALEGVLAANRSIQTGRPVHLPLEGD
jgi:myo-inositol 2-dehydrogenase/D-chiro-inositol 1-dehydrogenase/scyllo-inositol 2-dehydrogenase (NAD+)